MRSTVSERKSEILIRSAESRLGIIESLDSARINAERTMSRLSSPATYTKLGLMTGGGVLGMWALKRIFSRNKTIMAAAPAAGASTVRYLAMQSLTLLVFPWLRSRILGGEWEPMIRRIQPIQRLTRWLGLDK